MMALTDELRGMGARRDVLQATAEALQCELDRWVIVNPAARKVCGRAVAELRLAAES
ncbi:MAG: hypothetical protein M3Y09_14050 [Actinomycetota bacterium]|nr:hypothetical protein [Actinomycetota bacterium]